MSTWLWGALLRAELEASRGLRRLLGDQRGQAMVEYSTITFLILGVGATTGFAVRWSAFGNQTLVEALYKALQTYVDSVNFALSLAVT